MPDSFNLPSLTRQVAAALPVAPTRLKLGGEPTGLVIVDEVNGFATVGAGNLAPPQANPQVAAMVEETARLAPRFSGQGWSTEERRVGKGRGRTWRSRWSTYH